MRIIKVNDEVLYTSDPIVQVSRADIQGLKQAALGNPRQRIRLCGHRDVNSTLHEMLIVHTKSTYVRPHKHLSRSESFHVVEGVADIVVFDDSGEVAAVVPMGDYASGRKFFYRLSDPFFHTLLIASEFFVFHETTGGPFVRTESVFAPWAPEDKDEAAAQRFMQMTRSKCAQYLSRHPD
jgi:cupin fold WbuC family metalloprotein